MKKLIDRIDSKSWRRTLLEQSDQHEQISSPWLRLSIHVGGPPDRAASECVVSRSSLWAIEVCDEIGDRTIYRDELRIINLRNIDFEATMNSRDKG
jgi:hypothetical protein